MHLIPASADLISLTFLMELHPFFFPIIVIFISLLLGTLPVYLGA